MLKRKIYDELLKWKNDRNINRLDKCTLLRGESQVGKTFIVRDFANREYESFININLKKQIPLRKIFDKSDEDVFKKISANIRDVRLIPGRTLILLDEVEYCDNAVNALQYLAKDRRFDVIAIAKGFGVSGKYGTERQSYSAGDQDYINEIVVRPLDFEEFLWANGFDESAIDNLREYMEEDKPMSMGYHNKMENLFREYIVVGGLPEVVNDFSNNKDFGKVMKLQQEILTKYYDKIAEYPKEKQRQLIKRCYDSIPKQLNNELKKFKYSRIERGQTKRKYGKSVDWLIESGLVMASYKTVKPKAPLNENYNDSQFKLYINDTGLLTCMYGFEVKRAILNDNVKGNVRTAVYENIIAQCITANGYDLYYHKPDDNYEVEFIVEKNGEPIPIEADSKKGVSVSLENYIDEYKPHLAYKLTGEPKKIVGDVVCLPHYFAVFL